MRLDTASTTTAQESLAAITRRRRHGGRAARTLARKRAEWFQDSVSALHPPRSYSRRKLRRESRWAAWNGVALLDRLGVYTAAHLTARHARTPKKEEPARQPATTNPARNAHPKQTHRSLRSSKQAIRRRPAASSWAKAATHSALAYTEMAWRDAVRCCVWCYVVLRDVAWRDVTRCGVM